MNSKEMTGMDEEIEDMKIPVVFTEKRHSRELEVYDVISQTWRMKERMKTVSVALVLCLNVGVDPPDIVKTQPCARLECWIDPLTMSPQRALEAIGNNLQKQYERWQPRARYKHSLDPTVDEIKKLCTSLRRNAKEERVLFHYNGHGVPKPTPNGEIWVFNKNYTQYIPLSIYDLQNWMGAPSIYVYDCSNAGIIVDTFKQYAEQHEKELEKMVTQNKQFSVPAVLQTYKHCIQLAACSGNQILPMNPELPADLFTSCLTTPIKIALRCFILQKNSMLIAKSTKDLLEKIPGQVNDRRTMLGELNWIFTAITDTIAWNVLPRDLFQKLFRQDLLVASLFRNFLLAERIMRLYDCTPVSSPKLPPTYQHPMWNAWDLALDICLSQLHLILDHQVSFEHSPFFAEQLTAFQVWLNFGNESRSPPEQLPIVLQVLLSQVHRLRALDLLGRFLDLGPWAVNLALSVGIFPYVLKLLQSPARELRPLLVFIWAKILAVDDTCQADLVRDGGHNYFLTVLGDPLMPAEHRTMAAYILSCIVSKYRPGQVATLKGNLISICLEQLNDPCPQLRKWLAICLGQIWARYEAARWCGVRDSAHEKLYTLISDEVPEVRAAAIYALGAFINSHTDRSDHANTIDHSIGVTLVSNFNVDASPLVRKELVVALQWLFLIFESTFVSIASKCTEDEEQLINASPFTKENQFLSPAGSLKRVGSANRLKGFGVTLNPLNISDSEASPGTLGNFQSVERLKRVCSTSSISSLGNNFLPPSSHIYYSSTFLKLWQAIRTLERDPMPCVSEAAANLLQYLFNKVPTANDSNLLNNNNNSQPSMSAPSSPLNKSGFLSSDSPPTSGFSQEAVRSSTPIRNRIRKTSDRTQMKVSDDTTGSCSKPAVIHSKFLEWSSSYFAQPVMASKDAVDPEGVVYKERQAKFARNRRIRAKSYQEHKRIHADKLEDQVFINKNPNIPAVIKFHPYESYLVVADKDHLSLWDWEVGGKLTYFSNLNGKMSRITAVDFVNPQDNSLLVVGSDEGSVRIWKNITGEDPFIVSAWNVLHEMIPSTRGSGLILNWSQNTKQLLASGDVRVVRLWDCVQELRIADYPTGADCCITGLSRGSTDESLLIAGCGDGSVRVFDLRLPPTESRVMTWREHQGWVVDVQFHGSFEGGGEIISGSVNGDVKIWDSRKSCAVRSFPTSQGMTAMTVHPCVDLFACGSVNQFIQTYNTNGKNLSFIRYHDGFMGQRIGPVSCLAFHPYRINLAAGSTDSFISVYSLEKKR